MSGSFVQKSGPVRMRFDLALREGSAVRIFYGVTVEGMEGAWAQFVEESG